MRNAMDVARDTRVTPPHAARPLIAVVFEGLSEEQKFLPSTLLFDAAGVRLFERVCAQPEYYLARAEAELLQRHATDVGALVGPQAAIVEYGVGACELGQRLLGALPSVHSYVPIDVDAGQLARARDAVRRRGQAVRVLPLCQDFRQYVALPPAIGGARRRVAYFPLGTVGAFRPLETVAVLHSIREAMGPDGALLLGVDLVQDRAVHERAYDDAAGAMAAFDCNVLARLNREVDATFELGAFTHRALWNEAQQCIEMGLRSTRAQCPTIAGIGVALAAGEEIRTACAYKYTLEGFASVARTAGWGARASWVHEDRYALQLLEATE